jgi:hypothetical protein
VKVGDHSIHMEVTKSKIKAGEGGKEVTVIFDAGYGDTSASFGRVQPLVAPYARTVLFDRAGLGMSKDLGTQPRSSLEIVKDLEQGLEVKHIKGPFVLVGNQCGSANLRLFAARALERGEEVKAILHLDPQCAAYDDDLASLDPKFKEMRDSANFVSWQNIYLAKLGVLRALFDLKPFIVKYYPDSHRLLVQAYSVLSRHRMGIYNDHLAMSSNQVLVKGADDTLKKEGSHINVVVLKHGKKDLFSQVSKGTIPPSIVAKAEDLYVDHCMQLANGFPRGVYLEVPDASQYLPQLNYEVVAGVIKVLVEEGANDKDIVKFKERVEKGFQDGIQTRNQRAGYVPEGDSNHK